MTYRKLPFLAVCAVLVAASLALAGCGNDVPPNAVAKVGDSVIKKADFDRWLNAAAAGSQPAGAENVTVPDPPEFTKCVAAKKRQPVAEGAEKPTDAQLKEQCQAEYDSLKEQVMQFLISAEWIMQEAKERKVEISDDEVKKSFEDQKERSFEKEADYKEFLKSSGQTEEDLLFRVRLDLISNKIREQILEGKSKVSDEDIKKYYEENKQRFAQPERRDLALVLTRNEEQAKQARSRIQGGETFSAVAKDVSIDDTTKEDGGKLAGVSKGQLDDAFDKAVFDAKRGELTGPVKTQFGWAVFQVTKVTPASQQTLDEAKETIRSLIRAEREQEALNEFIEDFRKRFRDKTACADGYVIQDCDNAPDPESTTPASGGDPQGGMHQPQPEPAPSGE